MADSIKPLTYRYRCQGCRHDISIPYVNCSVCGLTHADFETDFPNLTYQTICKKCRGELSNIELPITCTDCGETKTAWWDVNNNQWYQPDLSVLGDLPIKSIWISGDFSGHYSGNKVNFKTPSKTNRNYDFVIDNGTLKNIIKIDGPPLELKSDEPYPIRQSFVSSIINSPSFDRNIKTTLYDFRLHFPEKIVHKEISKNDTIIGNINGRAYAYIRQPEERDTKPILETNNSFVTNPNNQELDLDEKPVANMVNDDQMNIPSDCFTCWFLTILLSGLVLWFCCDWQLALIGTIVMGITCLLDQSLVKSNSKVKSSINRISLAALLVILSIFGIGYYGLLLNLTNCTNAPSWPLLLPGISLLIAAWITNCFLRTILTALWIVSLLVWCGTHQIGVCNPTNNTIDNNIINPIVNSLNNVIESTTNITPDSDSAVISQISSDDTHLVTIDQAINNPDLLNDCRNNLYLPSATIFGFDQDIIDPSMDANLEKLNQILQKTHPQKIIITGYSDNSGDETPEGFNHNIELSQNRANAVANWLIEKGNITADRIDARGAGSKFPLTNILGQQSLNRRVEIKMQYPSCKLN